MITVNIALRLSEPLKCCRFDVEQQETARVRIQLYTPTTAAVTDATAAVTATAVLRSYTNAHSHPNIHTPTYTVHTRTQMPADIAVDNLKYFVHVLA